MEENINEVILLKNGGRACIQKCVVCKSRRANVRLLPCTHLIHARCFYPWPITECPLCRCSINTVEACEIEAFYNNGDVFTPPQNVGSISLQRSGRWSNEETAYAKLLMEGFSGGMLPVGDKTNLGGFLCLMLLCNSARLSSKLRTGKKVFLPRKPEVLVIGEIDEYVLLQKKISDAEDLFLTFVARCGEVEEAAALSHNIQYQWMRQFVQHAWATQQPLNSSSNLMHGGLNVSLGVDASNPFDYDAEAVHSQTIESRDVHDWLWDSKDIPSQIVRQKPLPLPTSAPPVFPSSWPDKGNRQAYTNDKLDGDILHSSHSNTSEGCPKPSSTGSSNDGVNDCFRELLAFARTVGPEAMDGSAHTSLRIGMRAVREILGLFPHVCSLAASHRSGEVFFASSALVSGLGVRVARLRDIGMQFHEAEAVVNALSDFRMGSRASLPGSTNTCLAFLRNLSGLRFLGAQKNSVCKCVFQVCYCGDLILAVLNFDPSLTSLREVSASSQLDSVHSALPIRPAAFLIKQSRASVSGNISNSSGSEILTHSDGRCKESSLAVANKGHNDSQFCPSDNTIRTSSRVNADTFFDDSHNLSKASFDGLESSTASLLSRKRPYNLDGNDIGGSNERSLRFPDIASHIISREGGSNSGYIGKSEDNFSLSGILFNAFAHPSPIGNSTNTIESPSTEESDYSKVKGFSLAPSCSPGFSLQTENSLISSKDINVCSESMKKVSNADSGGVKLETDEETLYCLDKSGPLEVPRATVPSATFDVIDLEAINEAENGLDNDDLSLCSYDPNQALNSEVSAPFLQNSFSQMLGQFLRQVPFHLADVWVPVTLPPSTKVLVLGGSAFLDERLFKWGAYSQNFYFKPSVGIPGRVLSQSIPEAQKDVSELSRQSFLRVEGARTFGLRASLAVPVKSTDGGAMVVVFYSRDSFSPSNELVRFTESLLSKWNFKANITLLGD